MDMEQRPSSRRVWPVAAEIGARPLGRFSEGIGEAWEIRPRSTLRELKRRERRAPCNSNSVAAFLILHASQLLLKIHNLLNLHPKKLRVHG
jgi:hypothetical protein